MDEFLFYLADAKHSMYDKLYGSNRFVYSENDCNERIKLIHKYEMLLDVISMLPPIEQTNIQEIIKGFYEE
ncbi:hypothetical protein G7L40_20320 [Paenibacillus polymyxa]|uniref:Uncharacterized protein n=1 Tax=Paenibacillus polymyxa TaxID=1406 RepID=A0A378Y0L6_PAEPO|nr:hypothetical protein [Paenibacillus polymyxa]MBE7896165.1 hypothetical protein [Paenibacillus polymyxa]MBG9765890.1 hypothetical protein [Paenibacillus polymyxa]MCC3256694.1 hypothetical protein [Paenibacillus polymyxa]QPK54815.1 hypothetical protein G7035_20365 [Paenibacillus polymyxa]QPK59906.1 hypothetical protein G7L40_20320 [Paenibacillus polymyxa]